MAVPLFRWGFRTPSNTMSLWPRPTSLPSSILIHPAIWPQQIWAENWGDGLCLFEGGAGLPSNTMWPGPRPTCVPSCILATIQQRYTHYRQTGQTVYTNVRFANHYLSSFLENFKLISVDFVSFRYLPQAHSRVTRVQYG